MSTTFEQKLLTKTITVFFLIVFAAFFSIASYWWIMHTNLSNIQTQKHLYLAQVDCKTLALNLSFNEANTLDYQKLQRHIDNIFITGKSSEFDQLLSISQFELLPQLRTIANNTKIDFNTLDRTKLIKELNLLCTGLAKVSDSINVNITSALVTNNYIYISSIIILLLLSYFIFYYFRNLSSDDLSGKNAFDHIGNISITEVSNILQKKVTGTIKDKAHIQQYINYLDITHKSLIQLVEDPESTKPFTLFLNEIGILIDATSSAIFINPNSASQLTMLACTDLTDLDWHQVVPSKIIPKADFFNTTNKVIEIFEETVQPEYKFICVRLHQGLQDFSLLVLKIAINIELDDSKKRILLEHSNHLASIVSSASLARLKLRHAQSEERTVIARELHDSLAQSLSYLKIQTSRLQNILTTSDMQVHNKSMEIDAMMQDLRSNLNIAYRHLRELISTFRLTLGGKKFPQALTDSVEEFSKRSGIAFDIDNRLPADILTMREETQLLHILRESLSNVVRHSQAKSSLLSIHCSNYGQITATVEDDGIGVADTSNPEQHIGIIIMQERAHSINGNISLIKKKSGGTCLKIVFQASKQINVSLNS